MFWIISFFPSNWNENLKINSIQQWSLDNLWISYKEAHPTWSQVVISPMQKLDLNFTCQSIECKTVIIGNSIVFIWWFMEMWWMWINFSSLFQNHIQLSGTLSSILIQLPKLLILNSCVCSTISPPHVCQRIGRRCLLVRQWWSFVLKFFPCMSFGLQYNDWKWCKRQEQTCALELSTSQVVCFLGKDVCNKSDHVI